MRDVVPACNFSVDIHLRRPLLLIERPLNSYAQAGTDTDLTTKALIEPTFFRNEDDRFTMALKETAFKKIPTQVKDKHLVERRRTQIADAAVEMFLERGFHKTTTRQIARAAGISNGLLYEYVSTKEDILYLVCTVIHAEMQTAVSDALKLSDPDTHPLTAVIREYFQVCHRMGDHILLIYQETQSLPGKWRKEVLSNEIRITELFADVLRQLVRAKLLPAMDDAALDLVAHNISVLGHMWAFRRWFLAGRYTIDDYTRIQTDFILTRCREAGVETNEERIGI